MARQLALLKRAVNDLIGGLNPTRDRLELTRSLSTIGVVIGLSVTVSAVVFPQFPAWFFALFLGDYSDLIATLLVDEQVFSLILGFSILILSSVIHFIIDIYLGTLGAFWEFSGDAFVKLLVLLSFVLSFAIARIFVIRSGIVGPSTGGSAGWIPINEVWIQGYHIHHFFFGFLFLTIAGWLALFNLLSRRKIAVLYGVGLGIFVDEFGMLLTEGDYFATSTYFVAVLLASLVLVGIYWDRLSERHAIDIEDL